MRSDARHSTEAEHTVWWMLLARAVERAAYERAAQACEAQISGSDHHYLATHGHWDHMAQAATNCAAAIRALGRQHD